MITQGATSSPEPGKLVSLIGGDPSARKPARHGWTRKADWYDTHDRLIGVVAPARGEQSELALAHGLFHRGDRPLWLVLPNGWTSASRRRIPFLTGELRVWGYTGETIAELPCVAAAASDYPTDSDHAMLHLRDRTAWVAELMLWAGAQPDLDPSHREATRSWQCRGTCVLKLRRDRATHGIVITAGIDYEDKTRADAARAFAITAPLTKDQFTKVTAIVTAAVHAKLHDHVAGGENEHWFQAMLRRAPTVLRLEQPVLREIPAWRPHRDPTTTNPSGCGRGFVDLVGLDALGDLHIVETKVGGDDRLVLQGVDYLAWARVHKVSLTSRLNCRRDVPMRIHYVVGDDKLGTVRIDRYARAQALALKPDIHWQFSAVTGWRQNKIKVTAYPPGELPPG
jgi:hypothetical protein